MKKTKPHRDLQGPRRHAASKFCISERRKWSLGSRGRTGGQLQVSEEMEAAGRVSGGIVQVFTNLLGAIIGYCQMLKGKRDDSNPLPKHAEEIEKAGQRAASLTPQRALAPAMLASR